MDRAAEPVRRRDAAEAAVLAVEGRDLDGVVRAIDFLINVNTSYRATVGDRVLVVGGGNGALDVARTARRGQPPSARAPTGPDRSLAGANAFRAALTGVACELAYDALCVGGMGAVIAENVAKLSERYPEGYTVEKARERDGGEVAT